MATVAEIRARVKSGEVQVFGQGGPKVGEGRFTCRIDEASMGKGECGNTRGLIKLVVTEAEDKNVIGGKFNIYEQTTNEKYMEQSIAMWTVLLTGIGLSEDKIYEDADDAVDIIGNIIVMLAKAARKGLFLVIDRKLTGKMDKNGRPTYYNNIQLEDSVKYNTSDSKPVVEQKTAEVKVQEVVGNGDFVTQPTEDQPRSKKW